MNIGANRVRKYSQLNVSEGDGHSVTVPAATPIPASLSPNSADVSLEIDIVDSNISPKPSDASSTAKLRSPLSTSAMAPPALHSPSQSRPLSPTTVDVAPNNEASADPPGTMSIRILDLKARTYTIKCIPEWTVAQLKTAVATASGVEIILQRLIYRGQLMSDEKNLKDYKLEEGQTIHLLPRTSPPPPPSETENTSTSSVRQQHNNMMPSSSDVHAIAIGLHNFHQTSEPLVEWTLADDPVLNYDHPLGHSARRIKLWSSMLLVLYLMNLLNSFALFAGLGPTVRENGEIHTLSHKATPLDFFALCISVLGVYVGIRGFKAAHYVNLQYVHQYCVSCMWLAMLSMVQFTFQLMVHMRGEFETPLPPGYSKKDVITAEVFTVGLWSFVWVICIRQALGHRQAVIQFVEALAAINPPRAVTIVATTSRANPTNGVSSAAIASELDNRDGPSNVVIVSVQSTSPRRTSPASPRNSSAPTSPSLQVAPARSPEAAVEMGSFSNSPVSMQNQVRSPAAVHPSSPAHHARRTNQDIQVV